jgi:hypothetical protein
VNWVYRHHALDTGKLQSLLSPERLVSLGHVLRGRVKCRGIIRLFSGYTMEAERINLIARRLEDVGARAAELRRYL